MIPYFVDADAGDVRFARSESLGVFYALGVDDRVTRDRIHVPRKILRAILRDLPSRTDRSRRLAVSILLLILLVVTVGFFLQSDRDAAAGIPPSDRQMPVSGQVLDSDRTDLLEEPGFKSNGEEP